MLRESMHIGGKEVDVSGVTRGFDRDVDIPHAIEVVHTRLGADVGLSLIHI